MQDPRETHQSAVKRILCYLKATIDHTLCIHKRSFNEIIAYSDSDWAGCLNNCRSTSRYWVFLGRNLLSWSSKKQPIVSHSSTKSKYKAIANASAEVTWIKSLLKELEVSLSRSPILYCDNIGVTYLTANPLYHASTKHIVIDYHFVRDRVSTKELEVWFIFGTDQIVDILTKPLISKRFAMLTFNLNIWMPTSSLKGYQIRQIAQTLKADTLQAKGKHQEKELHQTSKSKIFEYKQVSILLLITMHCNVR